MASAIIHLAIAKELQEYLHIIKERDYYLGSIAPDSAKYLGEDRAKSHFIINSPEYLPNIEIFTNKYPKFKENSFDLGYFIHLYTDKLWFGSFLRKIIVDNKIKLLNGQTKINTASERQKMIYSDYNNLNSTIIEEYDIDLSLFYENLIIPKTIITEIPIEKLDVFINIMGQITENSTVRTPYLFDINSINEFINDSTNEIAKVLKKY